MSALLTSPFLTSGAFFQKVAVSVSQLSFTTSHSSFLSADRSSLAFSDVAGFWPTQNIPFTLPAFIATNMAMCEWSPRIFGCQSQPNWFSLVAASPYTDFRYETTNLGIFAQYPVGMVSATLRNVSLEQPVVFSTISGV